MHGDQWQRMEKLRDQNDIQGPRAAQTNEVHSH